MKVTRDESRRARPIGIDLFAGAGGLSLGFEQAGFDVAAAVEIDPVHCATHEYNFPRSVAICASVVDLTGALIRERAGLVGEDIGVVFGGAPCQGFSMIGKRAFDDPRNQLVFHYVRLVHELNPKYCVFENVKGLTLGKHAEFLDELIAALGHIGYRVLLPYQVLNAADFGVPQDRRRLFLIAARSDQAPAQYPAPLATRTTVWEAIGDLPDADAFSELAHSDAVGTKWVTKAVYAKRLRGAAADPQDFSHARRFDANWLTSSLRTEHTAVSRQRFMDTEHGQTEPISRFRKLPPEGLQHAARRHRQRARRVHVAAPHSPVFAAGHHRARGCTAAFLPRLVSLPCGQVARVPADREQRAAIARAGRCRERHASAGRGAEQAGRGAGAGFEDAAHL